MSITKNLGGLGMAVRFFAFAYPMLLLWAWVIRPSMLQDHATLGALMVFGFLLGGILFTYGIIADRETLQANMSRHRAQTELDELRQLQDRRFDLVVYYTATIAKKVPIMQLMPGMTTWDQLLAGFKSLAELVHMADAVRGPTGLEGFVQQADVEAPPGYREGDIPYDDLVLLQRATAEDLEQANHELQVQEFNHGFERERHERYMALAEKHIAALAEQNLMHHRINPRVSKPWRRRIH